MDGGIPDAVLVGKLGLFFVAAEHPGTVPTPPMRATLWESDSLIGQRNTVPDAVLVGKLGLFLAAAGHPVDGMTPVVVFQIAGH